MSWALRKQKAKPAAEKQLNLGRGQQSSSNTRCQEVTPRPAAPQRFHSPHSTKTEIYFHFGGGRSSAQLGYETQPGPSLKAAGGGLFAPPKLQNLPRRGHHPAAASQFGASPSSRGSASPGKTTPSNSITPTPPRAIFISLINRIKVNKKKKS